MLGSEAMIVQQGACKASGRPAAGLPGSSLSDGPVGIRIGEIAHEAAVGLDDGGDAIPADGAEGLAERPHLMLQLARLLARRVHATTGALVTMSRGAQVDDSLVLSQDIVATLGDPTL